MYTMNRFGKTPVVHAVVDSIKRHYNEPYMNWTETPAVVKDHWFAQFKVNASSKEIILLYVDSYAVTHTDSFLN